MRVVNYNRTRKACYISFIVQAVVNNLAPMLFLTFQREFGVTVERIGALIALNFITQMTVDALAVKYAARIGVRLLALASELCAALGLIGLAIFPRIMPNPFAGLCMATILGAIGGGLIEVLISPILESLPSGDKAASMSFLHSFYCWGQAGVALMSAAFFFMCPPGAWPALAIIGACVPAAAFILFLRAPFAALPGDAEPISIKRLVGNRLFPLLFVMMAASGASEISMAQWASYFAETGLGVTKSLGDLLGPCAFAIAMGITRAWYGVKGSSVNLVKALSVSAAACVGCYLLAALSRNPFLSLVGCACCGFTVGLMWPGMLSLSARRMPEGGTALFAALALGGDTGCTLGPLLVSTAAGAVDRGALTGIGQSGLKTGLFTAILFPIILIIGAQLLRVNENNPSP
ncbi:MAG: MFS transporter [Oscillospiraceae bacterium]|jgi:MFS family permease|nr:MFS transporter [Oscillospiraceae bacterium]